MTKEWSLFSCIMEMVYIFTIIEHTRELHNGMFLFRLFALLSAIKHAMVMVQVRQC